MESSKHNDELIKRKLADLSAEPRKLTFAEVQANYEKARKASSNKWGMYLIIGCVGIASIVGTYLLVAPGKSNDLAQNTTQQEIITPQNTIQSVGTNSEDKFVERADKKTVTPDKANADQENANNTNAAANPSNNDAAKKAETKTEITTDASVKETSTEKYQPETVTTTNNSADKTNKNVIATDNKKTGAKKKNSTSTSESKSDKLTKVETKKNASASDAITNNQSKRNERSGIAAKTEKNTSTGSVTNNNAKTGSTKKSDPLSSSGNKTVGESISKSETEKTSQENPGEKTTNQNAVDPDPKAENQGKDIAKSETPDHSNGNSDQRTNNENKEENKVSTEGKAEVGLTQVAKADSVSNAAEITKASDTASAETHIPGVIGTGSVSPRNKHKLILGLEASYNTLFYNAKENPNSPSQFSTGDPAFATVYANAVGKGKYSLFTGAMSLGYLYNEQVGISAGLSYFSLQTKADVPASSTPVYTTAVDYYVWNYVQDTNVFPPALTLKIVDTVYKQVPTGNYNSVKATVNGDSANTSSYVNTVKYISIPVNFSYNFKVGAKFSIEPQAGILYTMPLKSSHLVATDAYKFDYMKQKSDLIKNLYFNVALKLGYNITNKMQLYIREGYFFRNQSVYNGQQPISMSLKSIYTSFGIAIRLK
jgi:hypothetical protein